MLKEIWDRQVKYDANPELPKKLVPRIAKLYSKGIRMTKNSETVGTAKLPADKDFYRVTDKDLQKAMKQIASEEVIKHRVLKVFLDAWQPVEEETRRVTDVTMNAKIFSSLRKHGKDMLDVSCLAKELKKGLMGTMWGARVWVHRDATEIRCYGENSIEFGKQFPFLKESKRTLKIKD